MATIPSPSPSPAPARRPRRWPALAALALLGLWAAACAAAATPRGWAPPVVSQNNLYLSLEAGRLSAYAREGEGWRFLWRFPGQGDRDLRPQAIYGTPLVTAESVYFGGYDGSVYALDRAQGGLRWRFRTQGPIIAPLALDEARGTLYAASDDGRVYALAVSDGSLRPGWPFRSGGGIWGRPLLDRGTLYVASLDGKLYALDAADGQKLWELDVGAGLVSNPVLAGDTLLVGAADRRLYAVDVSRRSLKWPTPPRGDNWFWAEPLVAGDTVFAPNLDGTVYALALADGALRWAFPAQNPLRARPLLLAGVLVVVDREGLVYGLDPATGSEAWARQGLMRRVLADPVPLDSQALIASQDGNLFQLDAASGQLRRLDLPRP